MSAKAPQRPTRIGDLNERLNLYDFTITTDIFGNEIPAYVLATTVWARIEPLRGVERVQAAALETFFTWHVTIRHRTDLQSDWRIAKGEIDSEGDPIGDATVYRIISMTNRDERRRFLTIEAETIQ